MTREELYESLLNELKAIKPPRSPQVSAVRWLADNWNSHRVFCLNAPVATGKSNIAASIQKVFPKTLIITASNILVNQYGDSFNYMNLLKGRGSYCCKIGENCADSFNEFKIYCNGCPYVQARDRAEMGDPTTANPMSFIQAIRGGILEYPDVLVVDEAHTLGGFIRSIFSGVFAFSDTSWKAGDMKDLDSLVTWLRYQGRLISDLKGAKLKENPKANVKKEDSLITSLDTIRWGIESSRDKSDWFFYIEKDPKGHKKLHIESIVPPPAIMEYFLKSSKIVLMSGTLFPTMIKEIVGDIPYAYLSLPSIIPKERRLVILKPAADTINKDTDPSVFAKKIIEIAKENKGKQGIIHTTYSLGAKLYEELSDKLDVRFNTKETKQATLDDFKNKEFQWLIASGMSEGIDLYGDVGEINIICKLHYPYLGDPYVVKRKSKPDGNLWYASCALLHLLQAAGRTTRGPDDYSKTYLLDPGIIRVLESVKRFAGSRATEYIPPYFKEAFII
jgi:ATP-dependent DNA helicase DinG